jgi:hypothetical protein
MSRPIVSTPSSPATVGVVLGGVGLNVGAASEVLSVHAASVISVAARSSVPQVEEAPVRT